MANMTFKASLLPNTDLGYSLGSDDKRWNIYGSLYGDAEKLKNIDGRRVNGSYMFGDGYLRYYLSSDSMTSGYPGADGFILHGAWDWGGGYDTQLCLGNNGHCYIRGGGGGGNTTDHTQIWTDWRALLDSNNYTNYTVTKTGDGASGTWGINISGTAKKLETLVLNSSTINSEAGSFMFSGSGEPWAGTDWVGLQVEGSSDKFQIHAYDGATLEYRQNDNGGTNSDGWGSWVKILSTGNYSSYLNGSYVTLTTAQTITAKKTFKETIIAYKYGVANNLPFITFDKPGNHATGIGPDGTSNRIHFGPCDLQGTAWVASNTFNSNEWHFQGAITGTSTATISGGIISNHGHNLMVAGNEVNFIPDGYNSTFWFNYDSFNRTNNSTITRYLMGNGSHGHAELQASKVYGAVWNDYAEYREIKEDIAPGRCVREVGDGTLIPTTTRLQRGCNIVSDTFGFAIGETERCKTPIAVSGRVLAYLYEDRELARQRIGYGVCSGPDGTVSIMTEEEERIYPNMIVGTISEVPDYEIWHAGSESNSTEIKVDGRIWIKVK